MLEWVPSLDNADIDEQGVMLPERSGQVIPLGCRRIVDIVSTDVVGRTIVGSDRDMSSAHQAELRQNLNARMSAMGKKFAQTGNYNDEGEVEPVMTAEDFESVKAEKAAEQAEIEKQKAERAKEKAKTLKAHPSICSSEDSFDFLSSVVPTGKLAFVNIKKKKQKPKPSDGQTENKPKAKGAKATKSIKEGHFVGGHRAKAKMQRFSDRIEELALKVGHCFRSMHDETWKELRANLTTGLSKKAEEILNGKGSDDNWRMCQDSTGLLSEDGLEKRAKLVRFTKMLDLITEFLEARAVEQCNFGQSALAFLIGRDLQGNYWEGYTLHASFMTSALIEVFKDNIAKHDIDVVNEDGVELLLMSAHDDTTFQKHAASCQNIQFADKLALSRIDISKDEKKQFQVDMWLTGFTQCFREKEDTQSHTHTHTHTRFERPHKTNNELGSQAHIVVVRRHLDRHHISVRSVSARRCTSGAAGVRVVSRQGLFFLFRLSFTYSCFEIA